MDFVCTQDGDCRRLRAGSVRGDGMMSGLELGGYARMGRLHFSCLHPSRVYCNFIMIPLDSENANARNGVDSNLRNHQLILLLDI